MQDDADSPPRAPPIKYTAPLGTRWAKEKAAAGGAAAFDLPTDPKNIGPWILGECIGKGASGRVKIARHRRTRQLAAVKILPITPLVNSRASLATQQAKSEKQRLGIDREITMMKLMNHPNIMRIYDVYEGEKELFLVLEYVEGGELFDFLVNRGRLPPNEALLYFRQIIYGLNYAHTFSIIHRDLKPENILIASLDPPIIKIADWGMAAFAPPSLQLETSCGSPHYASPEIVNGEKYFGTATDIWSCGVILFALLTGRLPFDDKNVRTLLSKVKSGKYEMPSWIDPLAKDLLTRMLVVDVRKRISIPEIISHPWFTKITTSSARSSSPAHNPVLPPSPSILARPISSPDMIDPELFNSLRVIWGRHAEAQTSLIQRDLCSPAGHGTYAKAFYFLLDRYREDTLRSRNDDDESMERANISIMSDAERSMNVTSFHGPSKEFEMVATPGVASSGLTEPQNSTIASISHASTRADDPPTHHHHRRSSSGTSPGTHYVPTIRQQAPASSTPPPQAGPTVHSRYNNTHPTSSTRHRSSASTPHTIVSPMAPRKTYHPSSSDMPMPSPRRATGPPMSPITHRHPGSGQRSAPSDISADVRSTFVGGVYVSPGSASGSSNIRSPSPMYHPRMAQMDVDGPPPAHVRSPHHHHHSLGSAPMGANRRETLNSRTPGDIAERVHGAIQAASRANSIQGVMAAVEAIGDEMDVEDDSVRDENSNRMEGIQSTAGGEETVRYSRGRHVASGAEDKENMPTANEGWTHVEVDPNYAPQPLSAPRAAGRSSAGGAREMGRDVGNRESLIPVASTKTKKDKERKSRPPPLELSTNQHRRTILGAPLHQITSPIGQSPFPPPPSAPPTNRIMSSPVVGEFRGWFQNLFSWKNNSSGNSQPSIFYSTEDGMQTRDLAFAMFQSMGFGITRHASDHQQQGSSGGSGESVEVYQCRLDQFVSDPQTGAMLKPNRFRVEFYFTNPVGAPGVFPPPSPAPMAFGGAEGHLHAYGFSGAGGASPIPDPNYLSAAPTPTTATANNGGFSFRPRHSLMMGGGGGGRSASSSSASTPTSAGTMAPGGATAASSSGWDVPPGCTCVITLVHEKGSTGTFKTVRQRLRDVFDARGLALSSCFSPMLPGTPFVEVGNGGQYGQRV